MNVQESCLGGFLASYLFLVMSNSDCRLTSRNLVSRGLDILIPIALFSSLRRRSLGPGRSHIVWPCLDHYRTGGPLEETLGASLTWSLGDISLMVCPPAANLMLLLQEWFPGLPEVFPIPLIDTVILCMDRIGLLSPSLSTTAFVNTCELGSILSSLHHSMKF